MFEREAALDFSELFMFYPVPFCSVYTRQNSETAFQKWILHGRTEYLVQV